jgi:hypothetical protein
MKTVEELNRLVDTSNLIRQHPEIDPKGWMRLAKNQIDEVTISEFLSARVMFNST